MSRAKKKRDNQVYIKDVEEWKTAISKPLLLVAELYAPHFGPCEIMFPFIDELMQNLESSGQADEVHWAIVNVAKLEDEKAASNAEDALKKQEVEAIKSKEGTDSGPDDVPPSSITPVAEPDIDLDDEIRQSKSIDSGIPYLDKYVGFAHPTPHYVFFRNGSVVEELRGANPPKLEQLVRKWIALKDGPEPKPVPVDDFSVFHPDEDRPRRGSMSLYAPGDEPEPDSHLEGVKPIENLSQPVEVKEVVDPVPEPVPPGTQTDSVVAMEPEPPIDPSPIPQTQPTDQVEIPSTPIST